MTAFRLIRGGVAIGRRMEPCGDDLTHVEGGGLAMMETLCGYVDTGISWSAASGPVTCEACWQIYQGVRRMPRLSGARHE